MGLRGIVVIEDGPARGAFEPIANRPIIHHVLDALLAARVQELIVACSFEQGSRAREAVRSHPSAAVRPARYVEGPAPVDLIGGLALVAPLVGRAPCVVHGADGLAAEPLVGLCPSPAHRRPDAVLVVHHGNDPAGRLNQATRRMLRIAELDPDRSALGLARILFLGAGAVELVAAGRWWGGDGADLTAVGERIEAAGGSLRVRRAEVWRRYCGDPGDLLELNRIVLDQMRGEPQRPQSDGNRIQGRVLIEPDASVRDTIIIGPSVIGAGARIANAYIGPYTSIGPGACIDGAEIEQSIIGAGATVSHLGCRLTGSLVGRQARIFRDFNLPRAMRLHVGERTEVALS